MAEEAPRIFQCTVVDFLDRYTVGETIGMGGFAVVKRGVEKATNLNVAIKVVDRARYAPTDLSLEREIQVLTVVHHPNCINLHSCYITPRRVYIVTELVTGGELLDRVIKKGNYTERDAAALINQILQGVAYLHSKGIVHRDLKLENIMLADDTEEAAIKIADFGLSKLFTDGQQLQTICGSPQYVAPEVLTVGPTHPSYTPAVDCWSIGVILYILLSGFSPFDDSNDALLFEKIRKGEYTMDDPIWATISNEAKHVCKSLMCVDPTKRMSTAEALATPWVRGEMAFQGTLGGAQRTIAAVQVPRSATWRQSTADAGIAAEPTPKN